MTFDRVYHTVKKGTWGEGPWQDEADKVQWVDIASGLDCLAVRNHMGVWCGYVGIAEGHPLFGSDYSSDEAEDIRVHGGLTFSGFCQDDAPEETSLCHVPLPGRPERVWWLGFDCGHGFDYVPSFAAAGLPSVFEGAGYRNLEYVVTQCGFLAIQLDAVEKDGAKALPTTTVEGAP